MPERRRYTGSKEDHTHSHGNRPGGALHATATQAISGFISAADKAKLDSLNNQSGSGVHIPANPIEVPPPAPEDVKIQTADSGSETMYALADHLHNLDAASSDLTDWGSRTPGQIDADLNNLLNWIGVGVTFPAVPGEGWMYYRNDLNDWFFYSTVTSTWLSTSLYQYNFGNAASSTNAYLKLDNNEVMGSAFGHWMPYDMYLIGMSWNKVTRPESQTIQIRANGVTQLSQVTVNPSYGGKNMALSVAFSEDDIVSAYCSGTQTNGFYGTLYMRRSET